jgi:hypothetical protein
MAASAALSFDPHARFSAKSAGQYPFRLGSKPVTHRRSFAPDIGERADIMSAEQFRRTIPELIAVALTKRVGPGKAMTVKQLAYALRVDQQTVWKLLNGYNSPSGPVLMALLSFFGADFANEILGSTGCVVAKLSDARADALRKVAEGMAELKAIEGGQ